jgi:MFS family permease
MLYLVQHPFGGTAQTLLHAAIAWHVYQLSGSAAQLGGLGLAQFAVTAALSLVGGAFADAHDRTRILVVQQCITLGCSLALAIATATGTMSIPLAYVAIVASAIAGAFGSPAGAAIVTNLVPADAFAQAVTMNSAVRQAARTAGPVVFGLVANATGLVWAYGVHAGLCAGAIVLLACVRPRHGREARRAASVRSVMEGVAFVRSRPAILSAMSLDMVAVIFAGATAVLPIYARDILAVGPDGFGVLAAALEVGTVAMGLVLVAMRPIERAGRALLWAVAAFGAATILFGVSESFTLSIAALALAGMADQISMVSRSLIVQVSTPEALRGRVSSVSFLFIGASNQLGAAESGYLASLTSAPFSVVFGGIVCMGASVAAAFGCRELREYGRVSVRDASIPVDQTG